MKADVHLPFTMCKDVFLLTLSPVYLAKDAELWLHSYRAFCC